MHDLSDADTIERLLNERWSCRAFLPQPLPRDLIERILTMAQTAVSGVNAQPWDVIVTSGTGTERFREAMLGWAKELDEQYDIREPYEYRGVYNERRRESALLYYHSVGISTGDRAASRAQSLENFRFYGAPHVAVITVPNELGAYAGVDVGAYVSNFLLAARALNIATVPQAALAGYSAQIREYFNISSERSVVLGISFGYPDTEHPANGFRAPRADLEQVVRWIDA